MGFARTTFVCVLWAGLIFHFSFGCRPGSEDAAAKTLQNGLAEPRRHRLQLLFPLLLRISTRLATLVPTALMGLLGIVAFVIFSKKALIVSLFALFLTLSGKINAKNEDVYIHKVNSYPDYNDEEHIHYHHQGPPKHKHKKVYHGGGPAVSWNGFSRKTAPLVPRVPLRDGGHVRPFKPLPGFEKITDGFRPLSFEDENEWDRKLGHV